MLSCVRLFVTAWTIQSMEFSGQNAGVGSISLLLPSPVGLPEPGTDPRSPALWEDSLPAEPPGKPRRSVEAYMNIYISGRHCTFGSAEADVFVLSPLRGSEGREPGGPSLHTAPWSPQKTRVRRPAGETEGQPLPSPPCGLPERSRALGSQPTHCPGVSADDQGTKVCRGDGRVSPSPAHPAGSPSTAEPWGPSTQSGLQEHGGGALAGRQETF